jgi:hypothetical protein
MDREPFDISGKIVNNVLYPFMDRGTPPQIEYEPAAFSWVKAVEPNFPDTKGYYICLVDIGDCLIEKNCYWNGSTLWNGDLSEIDEVIAWRRDVTV